MNVAEQRQTSLSMGDLIAGLESTQTHYPKCLLINELGMACLGEEDEDKKSAGKKVLLGLLTDDKESCRFAAFSLVSAIPGMAEEHSSVLKDFRDNPDNQSFLEKADKTIENFKKEFGL